MEDNSNTLRILVATDFHLGYTEKDEIRRHDYFQAFEEVGSVPEQKEVIEILRRHCLNDQPVQFQVVSDQTANFQNAFGHVNYEDPHFNVGLPVFSIHGNHDDPAGVGSATVALYSLENNRDERLNRMFQVISNDGFSPLHKS